MDIEQVLAVKLPEGNDFRAKDIREALWKLLDTLWNEGESFSGKRPFGNSGWDLDLVSALAKAGHVKAEFDEDGYLDHISTEEEVKGNSLIFACIKHVFYGNE